MLAVVRFLWRATRGNRLKPWRSPYLRWRLETYSGAPANTITASHFQHMARSEGRQIFRFAVWIARMAQLTRSR